MSINDPLCRACSGSGEDEPECDHDWQWVDDWEGDPTIPNGTHDLSGWVCRKCDSTDCDDDKPSRYDPDDRAAYLDEMRRLDKEDRADDRRTYGDRENGDG